MLSPAKRLQVHLCLKLLVVFFQEQRAKPKCLSLLFRVGEQMLPMHKVRVL